jgi:hypothetical protein
MNRACFQVRTPSPEEPGTFGPSSYRQAVTAADGDVRNVCRSSFRLLTPSHQVRILCSATLGACHCLYLVFERGNNSSCAFGNCRSVPAQRHHKSRWV